MVKVLLALQPVKVNAKVLDDILLVPSLSHNLLSVEQLMISEHYLLFDDGHCVIRDKASGHG